MISNVDLLAAHLLLGLATTAGVTLAYGLLIPAVRTRMGASPATLALRRAAHWVAANGLASLAAVALLAFASGAANGIVHLPWPSVNDEFAYLLGADTFASGRLANPQHDLWHHFETFAVSHDPVYASKYPPATSAFMAFGQVVFGHPWWGQLLAYALAAVAVAWMFRAWLGPRWGLIGGVLIALHPVMQHFQRYDYNWSNYSWSHSYWGGSVAMMGAALVFGGVRRVVRNGRRVDALVMALGVTLLAFSRPFEGLLAVAVAGAVLGRHLLETRPGWPAILQRVALPLLVVGIPSLVFLLYYNAATTGDPLRLAHQHYADQYGSAAEFLVQSPRTPPEAYRNREMARFYTEWVRPAFLGQRHSFERYWSFKSVGVERYLWFYVGVLAPALIGTYALIHRRWWRLATGFTLLTFGMVFVTFEFHPHYAAVGAPLVLGLLVAGMARLWRWRGKRGWIARATVLALILAATVPRMFDLPTSDWAVEPTDWPRVRQKLITDLEMLPENDLVVVSYSPNHSVFREWVKNGADLEHDGVIWARDLGTSASRERLLEHFADRKIWIFHADAMPPTLTRLKQTADTKRNARDRFGQRTTGVEADARS